MRVLGRVVGGLLLGLLLVVGLVALVAGAVVDTGFVRARVLEAIERGTGHAARIDGRIGLAWSLAPTVSLDDVVLLNGAGFSQPALASARRVEARVALGPLLLGRVEVPSVVVEGADVLLERDASGRGNWMTSLAAAGAPAGPSRARTPVAVGRVDVRDGRVAWAGFAPVLAPSLSVWPGESRVDGTVSLGGVALTVRGEAEGPAWSGAAVVTATGTGVSLVAHRNEDGGPFDVRVGVDDLAAWGPMLGRALPPLRGVVAEGRVGAGGVTGLRVDVGESDLGGVVPGLRLVKLRATSEGVGRPVAVLAQVGLNALPVAVAANFVQGGAVQAEVSADGATVSVQGSVGAAGLDVTVSGRVPDVQRTGLLAGVRLPALQDAAVDVRVSPAASGVVLRGLRFTSGQGDLAGDLAVGLSPRPSLRGSMQSQRLDMDAWLSLPAAPASPPAAGPVVAPVAASVGPGWLIPDRPLPFAALRRGDADVRASVGELTYRGVGYRSAEVRLLLQEGRLRVDPASMATPGGAVQATVQVDAGAEPPTVAVVLRGAGLDAAGLSAMAGAAGAATGTVDLDVDLRGVGATAHALAATATGHAAVALTEGEVENAALASLVGAALRGAGVPFDAVGRSRVRCLAVRMDVAGGQASLPVFALDASRLRIEGDGVLNLGAETMDLHVRPEVRLGPVPVKVPVHMTGPWRMPQAQVDKGVIAPGRFGIAIGGASADPCGPALAAVHQGLVR